MRKVILMMMSSILLFAQCEKDNGDFEVENDKPIPIRLEVSLDKSRSDFSDLFPYGKINWGNESGMEYIYLAIPYAIEYGDINQPQYTQHLGILLEMRAEVSGKKDKILFYGEVERYINMSSGSYVAYYLGKLGKGLGNKYLRLGKNYLIGKKMTFSYQDGSVENLGILHLAKAYVRIIRHLDETGMPVSYDLSMESFETITSIALLDLEGETQLKGTAMQMKSFSVEWTEDYEFEEKYEYDTLWFRDVKGNVGKKSLITLFPTGESVTLECSKGKYEFPNGIKRNTLYVGGNGNNLEEARPLKWIKP